MTLEFAGILIYVLVQLLVGVAVSRRIRTEQSYLLANRSLGYGLAGFSIFATWLGAETCIGSAGEIYENGLGLTSVEPFAYGSCLLLMGLVFATPLWRRGLTTVADLFRERFSAGVERFVVLLVVPTSIFWAAAQLRAFGQVLSASSDLPLATSIGVAAAVAVIYTTFGGLLADAVTDVVQGIALTAGLLLLGAVLALSSGPLGGGAPEALAAVAALPPVAAAPVVGPSLLEIIEAWTIPICGSVLAQELVSRVLGSRSARVARRSSLVAAVAYLVVGLVPVFAGLAAAERMPGLEDPEQLLLVMARELMPGVLYVVFAGALLSAILSTVDSTLLAAASLSSHNLIVSLRPQLSDRTRLRLARAGVPLGGACAWLLALHSGSVLELVEQASAFGSAGVFVAGCFGLFARFGGSAAASASLAAGAITWLAASFAELTTPYLASLAAALLAYLIAGVFEARFAGGSGAFERGVAAASAGD